jgi:hypothetical protein
MGAFGREKLLDTLQQGPGKMQMLVFTNIKTFQIKKKIYSQNQEA